MKFPKYEDKHGHCPECSTVHKQGECEEVCFDNVYKCSVCGNTETFWMKHNYVHCKKCDNEMHR